MGKKFWLSFIVCCVVFIILQYVYHGLILKGFYESQIRGFRPDEGAARFCFWFYVATVLHIFIWNFLYNRYVQVKNLQSGVVFGLLLMILFHVPAGFYNYAQYSTSGYVYLWGLIGGLIMGVIVGGLMGALMKPSTA